MQNDDLLYKYKSVSTTKEWEYLEDLIVRQKAYFSSPKELNDPFECRPELVMDGPVEERRSYFRRLVKRSHPNLPSREIERKTSEEMAASGQNGLQWTNETEGPLHERLENIGVYCLTKNELHPLMWAHYGDSHKGLCLGFIHSEFCDFWWRALRVEYVQKYPKINPIQETGLDIAKKTALTKGEDWKYEQEWRIVDVKRNSGVQMFPHDSLAKIILGARFPKEDIPRIQTMISQSSGQIKLQQSVPKKREYGLKLVDL